MIRNIDPRTTRNDRMESRTMRDYDHYVVWIGPVEDAHYRTIDEARDAAQRRRDEGWNDVRMECTCQT